MSGLLNTNGTHYGETTDVDMGQKPFEPSLWERAKLTYDMSNKLGKSKAQKNGDIVKEAAATSWDKLGDAANYVGAAASKGLNEALGGDDASEYTRDRRLYALTQGVNDIFSAGANNDIDRTNLIAANLGYAGKAQKPTGQGFNDRWYNEKLAGRAEANKVNDTDDRYMRMLMKSFEDRINSQQGKSDAKK